MFTALWVGVVFLTLTPVRALPRISAAGALIRYGGTSLVLRDGGLDVYAQIVYHELAQVDTNPEPVAFGGQVLFVSARVCRENTCRRVYDAVALTPLEGAMTPITEDLRVEACVPAVTGPCMPIELTLTDPGPAQTGPVCSPAVIVCGGYHLGAGLEDSYASIFLRPPLFYRSYSAGHASVDGVEVPFSAFDGPITALAIGTGVSIAGS